MELAIRNTASTSSVPEDLPLPLRMKCLILRAYPWFTGILAHRNLHSVFDSDGGFHTFMAQLEQFEDNFFTSFSREAAGVRQLLCYDNEDNDASTITEGSRHRMVELFVSYRLLDLLARQKGISGLVPVPPQGKNGNLGITVNNIGWKHIEDWKRLLLNFQGLIGTTLQGLPSQSNTGHLATLGRLLTRNAGNKILLNIYIAAMHLADILAGVDYLESPPLSFLQRFILNAPDTVSGADMDVIKGLMKAYKGSQLRLPLHAAVMISPLYLLVPIQLYSVKWDRQSMFLTSKAIGNAKPPLLVEIENQLLGLLFRLACSEGDLRAEIQDFSSWLEGKRPELINEAPDSKAWFKSDPSCTRFITKRDSMHLLGSTSRVFTVEPRDGREENMGEENMGDDRIDEDKMDEDEDTMDGNKADEAENNGSDADKMDIDGNREIEGPGFSNAEGGVAGANAGVLRTIDRAGEGNNDDDDDDMHGQVTPARRSLEGNDGMIDKAANITSAAEGGSSTNVHGTKNPPGEGNEEDEDGMHGEDTPARKDVEGNDGMKDMVMDGSVGVAGEDDGAEAGKEKGDNVSGEDVQEEQDDMDALTSIADEDDDDDKLQSRKAVKGKKPRKLEKPPVKILRSEQSKGRILGNAGLRKETAIDVDAFFYVEEISLEHQRKVKKHESAEPILAYRPDGRESLIRFVTHSEQDTARLHTFSEAIKECFVHGNLAEPVPLHVGNPDASIFKILSQTDFDELSAKDILDTLAAHCIVVSDIPMRRMKFDAKGLSTLSTLSTVVTIQDQSRGLDDSGYGNRLLQGTLQQLLECSQMEDGKGGKILNALHFPMPEEGLGVNPFSTDSVAWRGTKGLRGCNDAELPPTADIRWGLAATAGALHWWHIDSDGFGTYIDVKTGLKWWIVARPKQATLQSLCHYDFEQLACTNIFMTSLYQMEEPCTSMWDLEAILLTPGTRLIMRPNQPHAVYTPEHAICHGGHFYAISTIQDTLFGLVHGFVSGNFVTNTEHSSSRLLLRRMALFFHGAFVIGTVNEDDPARDHVPDLQNFKSFLDVVTLCNLVILMNALDGRTYHSDDSMSISAEERLSCIYTRGKCIDLLTWIDQKYRLRDPFTQEIDRCSWMIQEYFLQQISVIRSYKKEAEKNGIYGSESARNCTAEQVSKELDMVARLFSGKHNKQRLPSIASTSLAWNGVKYDVECKRDSSCTRPEENFEYYNNLGSTEGDKQFLATHLAVSSAESGPRKKRPRMS